jgi:tripartite-type tricarboxylate transporter receptor subunit TctC
MIRAKASGTRSGKAIGRPRLSFRYTQHRLSSRASERASTNTRPASAWLPASGDFGVGGRAPPIIAVNSASPYRTLADLIDAARAKPGNLTLGIGIGTVFQVGFEMLKRVAKFEMTNVPYPGAAPAVTALLGEHVTSVFYGYPGVVEQLKSGKLRALATTSRNRIESLPDVPTVAESGYKDFEVDFWFAAFAPARTPKAAVSQLANWFTAAIGVSDVGAKLVALGSYPAATCGADFAALLRKQYDEYGRIIREANIKAE